MSNIIKHIILFAIILLLAGCSSIVRFSSDSKTNSTAKNSRKSKSDKRQIVGSITRDKDFISKYSGIKPARLSVILEAESCIGIPYKYGGTTKSGFDCSGFVQSVFDKCGISLPRTSQQQYTYTTRISTDELEPGDLIFFGNRSGISHVAIYGGNGYMIHASTSNGVIRQDLDDYLSYQSVQGYGRPAFK
jgi:cell wall-associated NlpC family hydrolase